MDLRLYISCPICKSGPECEDDCPRRRLKVLLARRQNGPCPICKDGRIGLNASDFYECRSCHTQFTSGEGFAGEDAPLNVITDSVLHDDVIVRQLPTKGQGDFPLDSVIDAMQAEMDARLEANKEQENR